METPKANLSAGMHYYERVLREFGSQRQRASRRYGQFLRAGLKEPPPSPFREAVGGLIVGTSQFVDRIRRMLHDKPEDQEIPQLKQIRRRPDLATIASAVAAHFGVEPSRWAVGRRSDDAARAVAAYLSRCRFGYQATEAAAALGYRDHSSIGRAVRRVEQGGPQLQRTVQRLARQLSNR